MPARLHNDERGFGLVELLIVMVLLGVVGSIVTGGVVGGLQASRRGQARVEALSQLQLGVERMSRHVRAADPVIVAEAAQIQVDTYELDGTCTRTTYTLDAATDVLSRRVQESADDCVSLTEVINGPFLRDIANDAAVPLFTYADAAGAPTTNPAAAVNIGIRIVRSLPEQNPVTLETVVSVRNSQN